MKNLKFVSNSTGWAFMFFGVVLFYSRTNMDKIPYLLLTWKDQVQLITLTFGKLKLGDQILIGTPTIIFAPIMEIGGRAVRLVDVWRVSLYLTSVIEFGFTKSKNGFNINIPFMTMGFKTKKP